MSIAFVKLPGLPSERIVALVEPVLRAHCVEGVELLWRTDRSGWLLELTIEQPGTKVPGEGITVDLCSEISRDLSAALDVGDLIGPRYRLEVGSPGVERALYGVDDYRRFEGLAAKIKLTRDATEPEAAEGGAAAEPAPAQEKKPWGRQRVLHGTLRGVDERDCIVLETDQGTTSIALGSVENARLVFDWQAAVRGGRGAKGRAEGGQKSRGLKRSK